ncbi:MAG: hypothetical protein ACM3KR_03255 [Deltaproteobacteria bacterium]
MNSEFSEFVENLSQKYDYNDELKKVLPRVLETFVNHHGQQSKNDIFRMMEECPIFIEKQFSQEDKSDVYMKSRLNGRNAHIIDKDSDARGAYGKNTNGTPIAYYSKPIFDSNGMVVDKTSFIVIDTINTDYNKKYEEIFNTDINIPHLFHELGHAYAATKEEYLQKGNQYLHRVGLAREAYEILPIEEGKYEVSMKKSSGLILEEAVNSVDEEELTCKYLNCSKEQLEQMYKDKIMIPSSYNSLVKSVGQALYKQVGRNNIEDLRINNNIDHIYNFNNIVESSPSWGNSELSKDGVTPWKHLEGSSKGLYDVIGNQLKYLNEGMDAYRSDLQVNWDKIIEVFTGYKEGKELLKQEEAEKGREESACSRE